MISNTDLKELINKYSISEKLIFENTKINHDLHINGKRAKAFMDEYSHLFKVDLTSFDFGKYFSVPDKTDNQPAGDDTPTLTAGDLERGIITGLLNEQIIALRDHDAQLPPKFTATNISLGIILVIIVAILLIFVALFL